MASLALAAYLAASRLAGPLAGPILSRRLARGKEDAARLDERQGRTGVPRPDGPLGWLHCASVGEAMAALPLIHTMAAQRADLAVLVTTGTVTAARRLETVLPPSAIHQYVPVDTAAAVARFLDHWRPDLAVWIESELWPALVWQTHRRGIPMALVNARLSARSAGRWRRLPGMARRLLCAFRLILTQDRETVARLAGLGADALFAGNLKAAIAVPDCNAGTLADLSARLAGRPVWLAASTHPGEEARAIEAHRIVRQSLPGALMILAPRHPARANELREPLDRACMTWAAHSNGEVPGADTPVWLADTLGDMGLWYRLAPVTFVGGSLGDFGGHTPFEPVLLGSAVVHGPDTRNFAPAYQALQAAHGTVEVSDGPDLGAAITRLLSQPETRTALAAAATDAHRTVMPDVAAIAAEVLALMPRAKS